jgi:cell division control protein 6
MFDLVVEQTQKSGDLRVGIDLLKRAALNAERRANRSIARDDICRAYDISRYLHLSYSVKSLKDEEKKVLRTLAGKSREEAEMNAGEVYKAVKAAMPIGYTRFYEIVKKFDAMRLINLQYRDGKGRTRIISLRYDPAKIIEYIGED